MVGAFQTNVPPTPLPGADSTTAPSSMPIERKATVIGVPVRVVLVVEVELVVVIAAVAHTDGDPVHIQPGSTVQLAEQPSPPVVLPSSHSSRELTTPSPHGVATMA